MDYYISSDTSKLAIPEIHDYLSNHSYWAQGRSMADVRKSISNSLNFGIYNNENTMLGFARVISDRVVFSYLMDFFIVKEYRGLGLGKALLQHIIDHPELQVAIRLLLTKDAHKFYERFGFHTPYDPEKYMVSKISDLIIPDE